MDSLEFVRRIKNRIQLNPDSYGHFLVQTCLVRYGPDWASAFTLFTLQRKETQNVCRDAVQFDDLVLTEGTVEARELLSGLEKYPAVQRYDLQGYGVHLPATNFYEGGDRLYPSNSDYGIFPARIFTFSGNPQLAMPNAQLISHDFPRLFQNYAEAIEWWTGVRIGWGDGRIGQSIIVIPDYRCKVSDIKASGRELTVKLYFETPIQSLKAHFLILFASRRQEEIHEVHAETLQVELNQDADEIDEFHMYLTAPPNVVVDSYQETPVWHTGRARWLKRPKDIPSLKEIQKGEGEKLEFKPFITPGDSKEIEITETAVAFANTSGGKILIGVNDKGGVDGLESQLSKLEKQRNLGKQNPEDWYRGHIRSVVNQGTNRHLNLSIGFQEVSGKIILEIVIPEGKDKPYSMLHNKEILIRRGANNMRPDPDTELIQLLKEKVGSTFSK